MTASFNWFHNKYFIELIVFSSYVLFAMAWVGGTASMTQIMANMHINSLASASFISGAVTVAKIIGTFIAAWLSVKLGVKNAFLLAGILVAVGISTPFSPNYEWLLLSRFLMGLGGAFMIVYFNPIVMSCFKSEERSTINGLNAVAFNVGTALVLWKMPAINQLVGGWQHSLVWFSAITILLCFIWLFVKLPHNASVASHSEHRYSSGLYIKGLKDKFNWQYALTYSGILALYICLFTFFPKAGISQTTLVIVMGIVGTLAGIVYSKKYLMRLPILRWSGLMIVFCVFGLSFADSTWIQTLCALCLGFFIFFPITALVSIPHELSNMTEQKITVVFSLFYSISYLIATVVLWFFGKLVDLNGNYNAAFILITLLSASFFIGSFFLPEPSKNHVITSSKESEENSCVVS